MERRKILEIEAALQRLAGSARGVKTSYAIAKNLAAIERETKAIRTAAKPREGYAAYEQARLKLAQSKAEKDEKGQPLTTNNGTEFVIGDRESFEAEIKKLQDEHKQAIDDREQQVAEVEKLLDEEIDLRFFKLNLADLTVSDETEGLAIMLAPLVGTVIDE